MTLNQLSDSIYVINLKERTDRKKHIISELKKIDCINYKIVEAIDGKKLKNTTNLTDGMFGLISTYFNIYEDWKKKDAENIIIIEDDCVFVENFNQKLHDYVYSVPKDWDMMYFGANHNYHIGQQTETVNQKCIKLNNSYSAHCVLLKSHVFEELIFNLLEFKIENDVMMSNLQKKYNSYSSVPNLTSQIVGYSNIQNSIMDYSWLIK